MPGQSFPIAGGTFTGVLPSGAAERTINMYPIVMGYTDPKFDRLSGGQGYAQAGREILGLRRMPGLLTLNSSYPGSVRCIFTDDTSLFCAISGSLYSITYTPGATSATVTPLGKTIDITSLTPMRVKRNQNNEFFLVDVTNSYVYNSSTNVLTQLTSAYPNFNTARDVEYLDGYFITFQAGTNIMQTSDFGTGLTFNALNVTSTSASSTPIVGLAVINRNLFVISTQNTEVWYNAGNSPGFPLSPVSGMFIPYGCVSRDTIQVIDGNIFWLDPRGYVIRVMGDSASICSNEGLHNQFAEFSTTTASAYAHAIGGHSFYVLNFPTDDRTFVYDLTTGYWHERTLFSTTTGTESMHTPRVACMYQGAYVIGDTAGRISVYSPTTYTDNGNTIKCTRITKYLPTSQDYASISKLKVGLEAGVGLSTGQGSDPMLMMQYSKDGGHNYSPVRMGAMGKQGQYYPYVTYLRLGGSRDWCFKFTMTDPVPLTINQGLLEVS